jgi:hypothetical protein
MRTQGKGEKLAGLQYYFPIARHFLAARHFLMVPLLIILVLLPGVRIGSSAAPTLVGACHIGGKCLSIERTLPNSSLLRAESGVLHQPANLMLPVEVSGVQELGAATVMVTFQANRLAAAQCQPNPAFDVSMCNPAFDRDGDGQPDTVRFSVISVSGLTAESALSLATITWRPAAPFTDTITTTLELAVSTFTDASGTALAVSTENGQVTILPPHVVFLPCVMKTSPLQSGGGLEGGAIRRSVK